MRYREVIHAPLWLLAIIYFFMLSLVISTWAALGNNAALITLLIATVALIWIYYATALKIEIIEHELWVGNAHINLTYFGDCNDLDNKAIRQIRTRDADPAAFLAIRFWAPKGVQLLVNDTRDATPYWLISSNRGSDLIQTIKNDN